MILSLLASPVACGDGPDDGPGVVVSGPGGGIGGPGDPGGIGGADGGGTGGTGGTGTGGTGGTGGSGGTGGTGGSGGTGGGGTVPTEWTSTPIPQTPIHPPALLSSGAIAIVDQEWQLHRFTANGGLSASYDLTFGLPREETHASAPVAGPDGLVVGMGWVDLSGCKQGGVLLPVPFQADAGPVLDGTAQILEPPAVYGDALVWASVLFELNHYEGLCTKGPAQASQLSRTGGLAPVASPLRGVAVDQEGGVRAVVAPNYAKGFTADLLEAWTYETDGLTISDPAIGEDGVTYVTNGRHLVAIAKNGVGEWDTLAPDEVHTMTGQPVIGSDGVIVAPATSIGDIAGKNRPAAVAFRASDGEHLWTWIAPASPAGTPLGASCGTPALGADGTTFLSCGDGRAYGLSAEGGAVWSADVNAVPLSPLLLDSGTLVVPTRTGLTAIEVGTPLDGGPWARYRADNGSTGRAR